MVFHDFKRFLGESACQSHPPPKLCASLFRFMALMDPGIHVDVDRITAEPDEHTERFLAIVRADEVRSAARRIGPRQVNL